MHLNKVLSSCTLEMMTRKHNLLNLVYRGSVALAVDTFIWKLIETL